jgi:hypothetical protein
MLVVDRDSGDIDDLIDYFSIPINISAGSSLTSNFTGIYNYIQLELTIDMTCTTKNNMDESCVCLPGFTGPLCDDIIDCNTVKCKNGGSCVAGSCSCSPAYTGATCELGKKFKMLCILNHSSNHNNIVSLFMVAVYQSQGPNAASSIDTQNFLCMM